MVKAATGKSGCCGAEVRHVTVLNGWHYDQCQECFEPCACPDRPKASETLSAEPLETAA